MALNHLFFSRRTDTATLAKLIYRDEFYARSILERLVERGLVVASGQKKVVVNTSGWVTNLRRKNNI